MGNSVTMDIVAPRISRLAISQIIAAVLMGYNPVPMTDRIGFEHFETWRLY